MSAEASAEGGGATVAASAQRSRSVAASAAVVGSRPVGGTVAATAGTVTAALAETAADALATLLCEAAGSVGDQPSGGCTITMLEHFGHERMCPIRHASRTASREPHV